VKYFVGVFEDLILGNAVKRDYNTLEKIFEKVELEVKHRKK
jgi:hypothetical protein